MWKKFYNHLRLNSFKIKDYIFVTLFVLFNFGISILISTTDTTIGEKVFGVVCSFIAQIVLCSILFQASSKTKQTLDTNNHYFGRTAVLKLYMFLVITFVITPISSHYFNNVNHKKIIERQKQIRYTQDSLKIINDSLQKVYINSQGYKDSSKIDSVFKQNFHDSVWTVYDSEIKSESRSFIEGVLVIKKLNGSYAKCGESFEKCEQFKKNFCKTESQEILDRLKNNYNYTEYKNCLDVVDIQMNFDTTNKVIYDTIVVTKNININDLMIKYIKKGTRINDSDFNVQVYYKKKDYIKGSHYLRNSWTYVYTNNKIISWSVYRKIHNDKYFKFHRPLGVK